jgi:hypothetical protein
MAFRGDGATLRARMPGRRLSVDLVPFARSRRATRSGLTRPVEMMRQSADDWVHVAHTC